MVYGVRTDKYHSWGLLQKEKEDHLLRSSLLYQGSDRNHPFDSYYFPDCSFSLVFEWDKFSLATLSAFFVDHRRERKMKRQLLDLSGGFVKILYGAKGETRWIALEEEKTFSVRTLSFSFSLFIHCREQKPWERRGGEKGKLRSSHC